MPRSEGPADETGKKSDYKAAVLDLLDREMAAAQPIQDIKSQFEKLDELVANLMQQAITESDQPQASVKTAPAISGTLQPGNQSAEREPLAAAQTDLQNEFAAAEYSDQMFAGFMPLQDPPTALNHDAVRLESALEFNLYKDDMDPIPEFMRLQAQRSTQGGDAPLESILDSSQFEDMNDVLAEYATMEQAASGTQIETEAIESITLSSQCVEEYCLNAVSTAENEAVSTAEVKEAPVDAPATLIPANNPDASATMLPPMPQKATPSADQGLTEFKSSPQTEAVRISEASADKYETATSITAPFASTMLFPRRSKAPWIAIASLAVLASAGILAYFHSGNEQDSAEPPSAQAVFGLSTAVPIAQVSPRYPEIAIKERESSEVVLELDISSEGHVVKATPVSGSKLFHKEAVSTVMKWRYRPASLNGANVASKSRVTLKFNLGN
jgi:TonB family protein